MSIFATLPRILRSLLGEQKVFHVRVREDVVATVYDRPGRWMNDGELAALRAELRGVAAAAIPGDLDYGVFKDSRAPYENRILCVGRHDNGDVVGFNAMPRLELDVGGRRVLCMHLGLLVIHPGYQRMGFQGLLYGLGIFVLYRRIPQRPVWVSNVTEMPAVFGAVSEGFVDVYPSLLDERPPPAEHAALARAIMEHHRHEFGVGPEAVFDPGRFVIQGSYTGGSDALKKSFAAAPKHRDARANAWMEHNLDYDRGDDVLQIGKLDGEVLTQWVSRRLPVGLQPAARRELTPWVYPARAGAPEKA
jgi:hypothetical protein